MAIDQARLDDLMGKAVVDMAATASAGLVRIGERLGLYKAMAGAGPMTAADLAEKTGTHERYVREWLLNQAAGGYVTHHPDTGRFSLSEEQAFLLADESSPAYLPGFYQVCLSALRDEAKVAADFREGKGVGWHEHDADLFEGTERFFRPGYAANLVSSWIPALEGVKGKLDRGAKVADVGCGHGASTVILAKAFPKSSFVGFDYHAPSIEAARRAAAKAGVKNASFEVARSTDFPGGPYDLVAFFDCLHDMGDPKGAAAHVRKRLAPDGTWMIVEPMAGETVAENLNPVGRVFSAASTLICCPASLSQPGRRALGAQASEADVRREVTAGGFTRFRRAAQTPFNRIFEARP
jgi:2-polyprenyl-3-methyl-5-hydroxy-6-metoxy-1,4-benzoquinol methylase